MIAVLWIVAGLAAIATEAMIAARDQVRVAAMTRDAAIAQAAADGAVRHAAFELIRGAWRYSGPPRPIRIGQTAVDVIVDDGTMKLNPMTASPKVLATVLLPIVADPGRAARLAGAIVDWRTRNPNSVLGGLKVDQYRASHLPYRSADRPLETLEEIGLVAGMTPDILQRLTPLLTLFRPGRSEAPPPGHDADPEAPAEPARLQMAHIVAVAFLPSGVRFVRSADTRTVPGPMQPPACQNTFVELAVASVAEFGSYSTNSLYLRVTLSSLTDTNH